MSEFGKIAKAAILFFFSFVVAAIFSYFSKVFIARILGPTEYGLFVLSTTIAYIFSAFSQSGVSPAVSYFIPKYRGKKRLSSILTTIFWIATIPLILIAIFLLVFPNVVGFVFGEVGIIKLLPYILLFIVAYTYTNLILNLFRGYEKAKVPQLTNMLRSILFFVLGVSLTYIYRSALAPLIAYILIYIFLLSILIFLARRLIKLSSPDLKYYKEISLFSLSMFFVGILSLILRWTDVWMISLFMTSRFVGIYNVATMTSFLLMSFIGAFMYLYFPIATRLLSNGKRKKVRELASKIVFWNSLIVSPIFFLLLIFSRQVVSILFGQRYILAYLPLSVLAVGVFVRNVVSTSGNSLLALNKKRKIIISALVAAIINIVLNFFLIPIYGLVGAATATTISISISFFLRYLYAYREKVAPDLRLTLKPISLSLLLIIPLYLLSIFYSFNIIQSLILALLYLGIYVLLVNYVIYPIRKIIRSVLNLVL